MTDQNNNTLNFLAGKKVFVTGMLDNSGFGWFIAKALQESGATVIASCHPKVERIFSRCLTRSQFAESRLLTNGKEFSPSDIIACDVSDDASIEAATSSLKQQYGTIDALIHSVAFSREVTTAHINTSREAYLEAMSISSYSLVALSRSLLPIMNRRSSIVALSYLASERIVPQYGGGMASAKAALESDARMLSYFAGEKQVRVNIVSPGPFPSRAARSIGDIESMSQQIASRSPIKEAITGQDVANAVLFLVSDLSKAITGEVIHVDNGYHAMGV